MNDYEDKLKMYSEYLSQKQIERDAPDELIINSQTDCIRKLQKGLQDIKEGKLFSEEEIDDIINRL